MSTTDTTIIPRVLILPRGENQPTPLHIATDAISVYFFTPSVEYKADAADAEDEDYTSRATMTLFTAGDSRWESNIGICLPDVCAAVQKRFTDWLLYGHGAGADREIPGVLNGSFDIALVAAHYRAQFAVEEPARGL